MEKTLGVEKLTKKDAEAFRAFFSIIQKGKFEVQGEALTKFGALFQWASTLDKKIEATIFESEKPRRKKLEVNNGIA